MAGVRIPELPSYLTYTATLQNDDKIPYYLAAFDKTVWMNVVTLRTFILAGGGATIAPVVLGNKVLHEVTAAEAGGTSVYLPTLAGNNFFLWRDGFPLKITEYSILTSGGFTITIPGDILIEGQRFLLELYAFSVSGGAPQGGSASLFTGVVNVPTNLTLTTSDIGKLVKLRGAAAAITLTLPPIESVAENTIMVIEATIGNTKQNKIQTSSSQNIYMNSTSYTALYIAPGEVVWLFRGTDGWYVINDFGDRYLEVGRKPFAVYKVGLNELLCKGQSVNRADFPRLWNEVQTFGGSLVSDATWNTATATNGAGQVTSFPYHGCFSSGDGTITFRLPDLRKVFLRGLSDAPTDTERIFNLPGSYQRDAVIQHYHKTELDPNANSATGSGAVTTGSIFNEGDIPPFTSTGALDAAGLSIGQVETRPENVGVLWAIKA